MYFTKSQKQGVWFIIGLFSLAVIYHVAENLLYPRQAFDFTPFESEFHARHDSIQQNLASNALPNAENSATENPTKSNETTTLSLFNKRPRQTSSRANAKKISGKININTASLDELTQLPRVGPAIARRIIAYRTENGGFATPEEITGVKGIGPKTYQKLQALISVK